MLNNPTPNPLFFLLTSLPVNEERRPLHFTHLPSLHFIYSFSSASLFLFHTIIGSLVILFDILGSFLQKISMSFLFLDQILNFSIRPFTTPFSPSTVTYRTAFYCLLNLAVDLLSKFIPFSYISVGMPYDLI